MESIRYAFAILKEKENKNVLDQSSRKGDKTKDTELLSEPHIIIFCFMITNCLLKLSIIMLDIVPR